MQEGDARAALGSLGVGRAGEVERLTGGLDASVWRVELPEGPRALRVLAPSQARRVKAEVAAMRAAAEAGVPAPPVHTVGTWESRPVMLIGWCPGRPLLDEVAARPWRAWALGRELGAVQARMHRVDAPQELKGDWTEWGGPCEPALRKLLTRGQDRRRRLLHFDYHPLNVLVDGGRVSGVIDWANARGGDPRADVARTYTVLRLSPSPPGTPAALEVPVRRLIAAAWRRGYEEVGGPLRGMAPYLAWAAEAMARDLADHVGKPGSYITRGHLDALQPWAWRWRARSGLEAPAE